MGRDMKHRAEWEKNNLKQFTLKLNRSNESDVIDHLERQENVRQYLIGLIRKDMKR